MEGYLRYVDAYGICLFLVVTMLSYAVHSYRKTYSFWSSRGINGPKPLPFFGNALTYILNSIPEVDIKNSKLYGRMYGVYDGTTPVLILSDAKIIEQIWVTQSKSFNFHDPSVHEDPMIANDILMKHGHEAKRIRSVFSANMSQSKLRGYLDLIKTEDLMEHIKKIEGHEININDLASIYLLNTFIQIFYSLDLDLFKYTNHDVIHHSRHWLDFFNVLPSFLAAHAPFFLKLFPDDAAPAIVFLTKLVKFAFSERLKNLEKEGSKSARKDFLQQFVDSDLTDIEKEANTLAALGAAFDTTSSIFSFMFYELANNRHCMLKLVEEIDQICHQTGDDNDADNEELRVSGNKKKVISFEDLQSMKYLEKCCYETLRMHPAVIRSFRQSSEETLIPTTNIKIPANTVINVASFALHYDPDHFECPEIFDPDRWGEERKGSIKKCSAFPFGAGPRKCPAGRFALLTIKNAFCNILNVYDVQVSKRSDVRTPAGFLTTQPRNIWITFVPRGN